MTRNSCLYYYHLAVITNFLLLGVKNMNQAKLGVLTISGPDAKTFLQGQITCDLNQIKNNPCLGAHCNPKGRVIFLFQIFIDNNDYHLIRPKNMTAIAQHALKRYSSFYNVSLNENILPLDQITSIVGRDHILQGIPDIYPETSGKYLPHELNLIALGAISFDKGCYTGQEIIARMHYRGKLKTQLYVAQAQLKSPPLRGEDIYNNDKLPCGSIVDYQLQNNSPDYYHLLITCNNINSASQPLYRHTDVSEEIYLKDTLK